MNIWIDGLPRRGVASSNPLHGFERVLMFDRGVPVSEHTLPVGWETMLRSGNILTGGHTYSGKPPA